MAGPSLSEGRRRRASEATCRSVAEGSAPQPVVRTLHPVYSPGSQRSREAWKARRTPRSTEAPCPVRPPKLSRSPPAMAAFQFARSCRTACRRSGGPAASMRIGTLHGFVTRSDTDRSGERTGAVRTTRRGVPARWPPSCGTSPTTPRESEREHRTNPDARRRRGAFRGHTPGQRSVADAVPKTAGEGARRRAHRLRATARHPGARHPRPGWRRRRRRAAANLRGLSIQEEAPRGWRQPGPKHRSGQREATEDPGETGS